MSDKGFPRFLAKNSTGQYRMFNRRSELDQFNRMESPADPYILEHAGLLTFRSVVHADGSARLPDGTPGRLFVADTGEHFAITGGWFAIPLE